MPETPESGERIEPTGTAGDEQSPAAVEGIPDHPAGGAGRRGVPKKGNVRVLFALWAVIAAALGIYVFRSPEEDGARRVVVRIARGLGRLVGMEDRPRKPIGVMIRGIENGDERQRTQSILELRDGLTKPADFAQVFPSLIQAMKDESWMVRDAAASIVCELTVRFGGTASATDKRAAAIAALRPRPEEARLRCSTTLRRCSRHRGEISESFRDGRSARRSATAAGRVSGRRGRPGSLCRNSGPGRVSPGPGTDCSRGAATGSE